MPGGDRRGPMGMGAMTGRRTGYCAGYGAPGYANVAPGRGVGPGFGRGQGGYRAFGGGRGRRNRFYATGLPGWQGFGGSPYGYPAPQPDPAAEKNALQANADMLQAELDAVKKRLSEIESGGGNAE